MARTKSNAVRQPANLSIDSALLSEAQSLELNISRAAEAGIASAVAEEKKRRWLEENREALESWNEYTRKHGLPLEKYRLF